LKEFVDKAGRLCLFQRAKLRLGVLKNMVPSSSPPFVATHNQPVRYT